MHSKTRPRCCRQQETPLLIATLNTHTWGRHIHTYTHLQCTFMCTRAPYNTHTHTVTTTTHCTALTHPAISISVRLTDQVAGLVSGMLHHTGGRGTREAACSATHNHSHPHYTIAHTIPYIHTCTCVTRPLATNIHISDFCIAIQLTYSQHILHRYIHSHATHIFIGWVQEICKLFYISRTFSIGTNGFVEGGTPSL